MNAKEAKKEISKLHTKIVQESGRRRAAEDHVEKLIKLVAKCENEVHLLRYQVRRKVFRTMGEYRAEDNPIPLKGRADQALVLTQ